MIRRATDRRRIEDLDTGLFFDLVLSWSPEQARADGPQTWAEYVDLYVLWRDALLAEPRAPFAERVYTLVRKRGRKALIGLAYADLMTP